MREIPAELQARLDGGATTLARCWHVLRRDSEVMGFTDHDEAIEFDGVVCEPGSGFGPSAVEQSSGLSADSHDVSGALSSERITADDIARGLYGGAEVTLWLVDWQEPEVRVLLSRGLIGEIRRGEASFEAEITGLADRLGRPFGRAYLPGCSARLGDTECGIDLARPEYRGMGAVIAVRGAQLFGASGLDAFSGNWFAGGRLVWQSGANAGLEGHVKAHGRGGQEAVVELWLSPPMEIAPGDVFEIFAGCNKTAVMCSAKFDNILNFRGFPHMPGDDALASYPGDGGTHDGGSLFRG